MIFPTRARRSRNAPTPRENVSVAEAAMSVAALTVGEFAAALDGIGGFEARPFIAVAVSGGPDSMALAFLADRRARHSTRNSHMERREAENRYPGSRA